MSECLELNEAGGGGLGNGVSLNKNYSLVSSFSVLNFYWLVGGLWGFFCLKRKHFLGLICNFCFLFLNVLSIFSFFMMWKKNGNKAEQSCSKNPFLLLVQNLF